jgi:hypothetical protein
LCLKKKKLRPSACFTQIAPLRCHNAVQEWYAFNAVQWPRNCPLNIRMPSPTSLQIDFSIHHSIWTLWFLLCGSLKHPEGKYFSHFD